MGVSRHPSSILSLLLKKVGKRVLYIFVLLSIKDPPSTGTSGYASTKEVLLIESGPA
jgi:hypothetical protein